MIKMASALQDIVSGIGIMAFCCVGCAIVFYGTFIMMFLVGIIQFLLGM